MTDGGEAPGRHPVGLRWLDLSTPGEIRQAILAVGADPAGLRWMAPRGRILPIRMTGLSPYAANLLKQEMLSFGGDCAVHARACLFRVSHTDALLLGTEEQLRRLVDKLAFQPPTLRALGPRLDALLRTLARPRPKAFEFMGRSLPLEGQVRICGILNLTPDSFSDGGRFRDVESAVSAALDLVGDGADWVDVGGESTRPGHRPVSADEEADRVLPVIRRLRERSDIPISIDTSKAAVADAALSEGADIVNDVWGTRADPGMADICARHGAGVVLMHNRGTAAGTSRPQAEPTERETALEFMDSVLRQLEESVAHCLAAGIPETRLVVDPGIGFGISPDQSLALLRHLRELDALGRPVMIGPSRKSFIGAVLGKPVDQRVMGTAAAVACGIQNGADFVRVHDVAPMRDIVRLAEAIRGAGHDGT